MILDTIVAATKARVAKLKESVPLELIKAKAEVIARAERAKQGGQFPFAFEKALRAGSMNFICEVKKASPSKGVIAQDFPYLAIAKDYEKAGAAAISVLTEPDFFQGSDTYLTEIAKAVQIPVLRKDFTIDRYQIYEAKVIGASAILLICAILSEEELKNFHELANSLGLACLVEAHSEAEITKALNIGARIIGVNNRDLRDFTVDINHSLKLRKLVPDSVIFVSESGLNTAADIEALRENGIGAALIGERFMRVADKGKAIAELYGKVPPVKAKICGLKRPEDIALINALPHELRPEYIGFVFAPSKRQVTCIEAKTLAAHLVPTVKKAGIFVNESLEVMAKLAIAVPLDVIQLSGDETEEDIEALRQLTKAAIWKAVPVKSAADVAQWRDSSADLILFDTFVKGERGGSGQSFDWSLLRDFTKPFMLAGGLNITNVARAMRIAKPYGVDVSSGVETDGVKDEQKIEEFLKMVKQ